MAEARYVIFPVGAMVRVVNPDSPRHGQTGKVLKGEGIALRDYVGMRYQVRFPDDTAGLLGRELDPAL